MNKYLICKIKTNTVDCDNINYILQDLGAVGIEIEDPQDFINLEDDGFGIVKPPIEELYCEIDVVEITAYFEYKLDSEKYYQKILSEELAKFNIELNTVPEWSIYEETIGWKDAYYQSFSPLKITNNITIVPIWLKENYVKSIDEKIIYIEPGLAFGTGEHPTTKLALNCLEKIDSYLVNNSRGTLIDVGTGTCILAIAAKLLGWQDVYAFDLDEKAIEEAKNTLLLNSEAGFIKIEQKNLLKNVNFKADVIIANIVADILIELIDDSYNILNENGILILSGIEHSKVEFLKSKLCKFSILEHVSENGWNAYILQK